VLGYSTEKPQDIDKTVFYGKPIPKVRIKYFSKIIALDQGSASDTDLKERTNFSFAKADKELVIIKDKSEFDYLYYTSIKNKKTNEIIFRSTAWEYGHFIDENGYLPHVSIDKSIFKKSGDYEIIIQPLIKWQISSKDIQKYITKHTLSITLEDESYSKKELIIYGLIICAVFGAIGGAALTYIKKKEAKKIAQQYKEKEIAKLQLNSIRSQLNPHFLFNALAGIQNLMNKNEIDNANKYLSKFARLTRNVLDGKELINLGQEKTLLDDYLQMEQLRFGFQYEINADKNLDLENIEIPSMLLQPFVENAVKHGIASKNAEGKIEIAFGKNGNNLVT
ncbi:MAG: sensor histidine kinase, partial [Pedobacter sp.]